MNLPALTNESFHPLFPMYYEFGIEWSNEMGLIERHYGDKRAKRSQVPLMNHILEGLTILNWLDADDDAKRAFIVHPIIQADEDMKANWEYLYNMVNPRTFMLAMEYRNTANAYLSHRKIKSLDEIQLSVFKEVNDMLIADKVQNYKDFLKYHAGTHPRSVELDQYFNNWITKLDCWEDLKEFKDR